MEGSPRELRLSSTVRGVIIAALLGAYAWVLQEPEGSFKGALLAAAGVQIGVLLLRKFVPSALLPQALYLFELLADAATVLLFAMGVFGGVLRVAYDF